MISHREKFLSSDTSVAGGATEVDGTDFTSAQVDLRYAEFASITMYVKGADAGAGNSATFKFAAYDEDRDQWDTLYYITNAVAINGNSDVQETISINPDVRKIKLLSIQNGDDAAITANASIFVKERT